MRSFALQRVEGHAKGLTTTNLELREALKTVEEEKLSWERRYMSLQAKEESLVRQIELAIQQRTDALQMHLAKGGAGALSQLMDQVRQHQLDLFAAQEMLRFKEEELSKALSEKEILAARIASFASEMIDLRQAAGPTANLISKLKEDARSAQHNERTLREELRAMKEGAGPKLAPLEAGGLAREAGTQTRAPRCDDQAAQTDDVRLAGAGAQADAARMKAAMEGLRGAVLEKERTIEAQAEEMRCKQGLIQMYIDSSSAQLDRCQAKHVELQRAVEERGLIVDTLRAEMDAMEGLLKEVEQSGEGLDSDSDAQAAFTVTGVLKRQDSVPAGVKLGAEAEEQLLRLSTQNQRMVHGYRHAVDRYRREHARTEELLREVQLLRSGDPAGTEAAELCQHYCGRALQLARDIVNDALGVKDVLFSPAQAAAVMEQGRRPQTAKAAFEGVLQSLVSAVRTRWAGIADVVATLQQTRHEASELAHETAAINFSQLVGATRHAELTRALATAAPAKAVPKTMQERYEAQRGRWERRKAQIQEERSAGISRCLDSFMKVVEVNLKLPPAASLPAPPHSARAVVYSTLLDLNHTPTAAEQSYRSRVSPSPQRVVHTSVYTLPMPPSVASPDNPLRLRLNSATAAAAERHTGHLHSARSHTRSRGTDPADHHGHTGGAVTARERSDAADARASESAASTPGASGSNGSPARPGRITLKSSQWTAEGGGYGEHEQSRIHLPLSGLPATAGTSWRDRMEARLPSTARNSERLDMEPRRPWGVGLGRVGRKESGRDRGRDHEGRESSVHVVKLLPFLL
jgi:hypothetical protein